MTSKYLIASLAFTLLGLAYYHQSLDTSTFLQTENNSPIVGIFTQPSEWNEYPSKNYSYIASSYVKFIEQSGARVVAIPYDADNSTLETIFQNINGILVPGGATGLIGPTKFTRSVAYMLNRAIQSNDAGDIFPIMAVCLGHEAIHYILSDYDADALIAVTGEEGILHPIEKATRSSFFYKDMSDELFLEFTTSNISYYHHSWAVSPNLFMKHQKLNEIMEVTGVNEDDQHQIYIASSQGKKYPIYTTQYHSEKNAYEWEIDANHSQSAVEITHAHSKAFVSETRKNHHKFSDSAAETVSMIYNSPTIHLPQSHFTEVYIIKKTTSTIEE